MLLLCLAFNGTLLSRIITSIRSCVFEKGMPPYAVPPLSIKINWILKWPDTNGLVINERAPAASMTGLDKKIAVGNVISTTNVRSWSFSSDTGLPSTYTPA